MFDLRSAPFLTSTLAFPVFIKMNSCFILQELFPTRQKQRVSAARGAVQWGLLLTCYCNFLQPGFQILYVKVLCVFSYSVNKNGA